MKRKPVMNNFLHSIENEDGSVIILSLLVLVVLSIVGFSASRISTTEMQIVRNDATYQQNFYLAESGAIQAAQLLNNITDRTTLVNRNPTWLNTLADVDADNNSELDDVGTWFASSGGSQTGDLSNLSAINPDMPSIEYAAVDLGVAAGQPLGINAVKVHNYTIVGIGNRNARGQITVQIGYRKRY
jgi:Tfp pilus assembly protein PilX